MRKPTAFAIVLTVTTALLVGAPAQAGGPTDPQGGEVTMGKKGGLKYLSETLDVGSSGHYGGNVEGAWISCGPHNSPWQPVSGGGSVLGPSDNTMIKALVPTDLDDTFENPDDSVSDDWWMTRVSADLGSSFSGFAICSQQKLRWKSTETPDGDSAARTGSTTCPGRRKLVGGGSSIATTDSWTHSSYPSGRKWKARILDTVGGLGGMSTYAVCRKKGDIATTNKTKSGIPSSGKQTVTAKCAASRHVIGGGGKLSGSIAAARLTGSRPWDGPDADDVPDDGWTVSGYNVSGVDKSLTAYALCVKRG